MIVLVVILAVVVLALVGVLVTREHDRARTPLATASPTRILFPFTGHALSQRGLDAALRIARIDNATLVPVFLAHVPLHLPLDAALPRQCDSALPLLEAIEHRAARAGVAVDARIERGRTLRHAIRELIAHETVDTLVVSAGDATSPGLLPDDIGWLLEHVAGEIIVIRPGVRDLQVLSPPPGGARHKARPAGSTTAQGMRRAAGLLRPRSQASGDRIGQR